MSLFENALGQLSGSRRVVAMKVCLCIELTKIIKPIDIFEGIFYLNRLSYLVRLVIKWICFQRLPSPSPRNNWKHIVVESFFLFPVITKLSCAIFFL